jgi:hypothetical protein
VWFSRCDRPAADCDDSRARDALTGYQNSHVFGRAALSELDDAALSAQSPITPPVRREDGGLKF